MKTLKTLLLALLVCSLSMACKKDKKDQPTQIGANKMYAKVNGTPWQSKPCWGCISGGGGLDVSFNGNYFAVTGENNDQNIIIGLYLKNVTNSGYYELTSKNFNRGTLDNYNSKVYFTTTLDSKGSITITKLDLANKIISGTFEFNAEDNENTTNSVKVTDGWFDITYQ